MQDVEDHWSKGRPEDRRMGLDGDPTNQIMIKMIYLLLLRLGLDNLIKYLPQRNQLELPE